MAYDPQSYYPKSGDTFESKVKRIKNVQDADRLLSEVGGRKAYGADPYYTQIVDHLNSIHENPVTPMKTVKGRMAPLYDDNLAALQIMSRGR
jgi:2-iminoacetate synthase ThiH